MYLISLLVVEVEGIISSAAEGAKSKARSDLSMSVFKNSLRGNVVQRV